MQTALKTLQNPGASARGAVNTWPGTSIPKSTRNAFDWLGRNSYVVSILDQHVKAEAHKTMVRHRMLRGNPYLPDGAGNGSE